MRVSLWEGSPTEQETEGESKTNGGAAGPEAADLIKERKPHTAAGRERRAQGCSDSNLASN